MVKQGVILIDKPEGISSRKVVDRVMSILKVKKAGHFGSLDPFATGLLCMGIGQGTKLLPFMQAHQKEYIAVIGLEMFTDTDDITGKPITNYGDVSIDIDKVQKWFDDNNGWIDQVPPDYCAQKYKGQPLYKLKRANIEVQPRQKQVYIEETEILSKGRDWIETRVVCSRGTYIRSIARDLGSALGCGGYLRELRRIKSEGFCIDHAMNLDTLRAMVDNKEDVLIPLAEAVQLPKVLVTKTAEAGIKEGHPIQKSWILGHDYMADGTYVALVNDKKRLLCIARIQRSNGIWAKIERGFMPF